VGGSISARTPIDNLQLLTIKSPDIKAGCGGIDIFGGAFSFINAEQFTQFLQSIGSNALGYAFSLGLEAICPTCNSALKWLRDQMNQINKLSTDSCMAAKALVNTAGSAAGLWDLQSCAQTKGAGDPVTGWLQCASGSENDIRQQLKSNADQKTQDAIANKKKEAPRGSTTAQALQWSGLSADQKQQIMSMVGTWATSTAEETSDCTFYPATLSLEDLVNGGTVTLLKCGSGGLDDSQSCENITTEEKTIDGFTKMVKDEMNAILTKYKNNTPLTDDEKSFISSIPVPPIAYMLKSSLIYSETLANDLIDTTSEAAATMLAWHLLDRYIAAYEQGISKMSACGLEYTDIADQIREIRQSRQELFDKYMKVFNAQAKFIQFAGAVDLKVASIMSEKIQKAMRFANE
jgi:conjugative transfer pilus assembly protein TraH